MCNDGEIKLLLVSEHINNRLDSTHISNNSSVIYLHMKLITC